MENPLARVVTADEWDAIPDTSGHYWRVETAAGAVAVHTYRLGEGGRYLETGLFGKGDRISDPALRWAEIEMDDLAP